MKKKNVSSKSWSRTPYSAIEIPDPSEYSLVVLREYNWLALSLCVLEMYAFRSRKYTPFQGKTFTHIQLKCSVRVHMCINQRSECP